MNQLDTVEQRTTRKLVILNIRGIINQSSTTASLQTQFIIMNQPPSSLNYFSFIKHKLYKSLHLLMAKRTTRENI